MRVFSACPVRNLLQKISQNFLRQVKLTSSTNKSFELNSTFYRKMVFNGACLISLSLFFVITFYHPLTFAQAEKYQLPDITEGQINEALQKTVPIRLLPSHPLYFLISAKEIISRFFQPSSIEKTRFDFILLGKRLKETYLLFEKGDFKGGSKNLRRYSQRASSLVKQMEKARAQNQSVVAFADETAQELQFHEILFSAIANKWQNTKEYDMEDNFGNALGDFVKVVLAIDNVQPGLKNRFKTATSSAILETAPAASPSPTPSTLFETSPSARPRRIIY